MTSCKLWLQYCKHTKNNTGVPINEDVNENKPIWDRSGSINEDGTFPTEKLTEKLVGLQNELQLADEAVTEAKIAVGAIKTPHLDDWCITDMKLAAGAITEKQTELAKPFIVLRRMMAVRKSKRGIEKIVRSVMDQSMKSLLHDIDYRISILADLAAGANRVHSAELSMNIPWHLLDGFTFEANSPAAGNVKWTGCHIVYKGTDYTIADGDTDKKYVCWLLSSPTAFTCGDVKPELTIRDKRVCRELDGARQWTDFKIGVH